MQKNTIWEYSGMVRRILRYGILTVPAILLAASSSYSTLTAQTINTPGNYDYSGNAHVTLDATGTTFDSNINTKITHAGSGTLNIHDAQGINSIGSQQNRPGIGLGIETNANTELKLDLDSTSIYANEGIRVNENSPQARSVEFNFGEGSTMHYGASGGNGIVIWNQNAGGINTVNVGGRILTESSVTKASATGIELQVTGGTNTINIADTAEITACGISSSGWGNLAYTVQINDAGSGINSVLNDGILTNEGVDVVNIHTKNGSIRYAGSGTLRSTGNFAKGIRASIDDSTATSDIIIGDSPNNPISGIIETNGLDAHGIHASNAGSGNTSIYSAADITTFGTNSNGIYVDSAGSGFTTIANSGTIRAADSTSSGIRLIGDGVITNSGTIVTGGSGLKLENGAKAVNSGLIQGRDINLGNNTELTLTNGGIVQAQKILGTSTAKAVFNGGTILATIDTADYFTSLGTLEFDATGLNAGESALTFDTNGHDVTITNAFSDATTNDLALTKTGQGTLTLSGQNTAGGIMTQSEGMVNLNSQWFGDYRQDAAAGKFASSDGALIGGDAAFGDVVNPTGTLTVGGEFKVESTGTLVLDLATDKLVADSVIMKGRVQATTSTPNVTRYDDVITTNAAMNTSRMNELFSNGTALRGQYAEFRNNATIMDIVFKSLTVGQFANQNHLSSNTERMAELFDAAINDPTVYDLFYGPDAFATDASLKSYLLGSLGGELAADAQTMALWRPWRPVYDRMYDVREANSGFYRAQSPCKSGGLIQHIACRDRGTREFWGEGYYLGENVSGDRNANGYDATRGGVIVGVDQRLGRDSLGGFTFAYGNPHISNAIGKVEANDYTLGLYSRIHLAHRLYANTYLGYGHQEYSYRRYAVGPDKTKYDGNAMYASIELFRPIGYNHLTLFPLMAVDFQKAWIDGFTETPPSPSQISVAKSDVDQTVLRVGFNSKYAKGERINIRSQLQYGYQVGGDTQGATLTSLAVNPGDSRMLTGVNLGRNMFNAGIGSDLLLTTGKRTRLFMDYDFDLGERATAHTGQLGCSTIW